MASIQTGHGGRGRRPVDAEVALIPFIDLLLCCVMFLLVTAVWNQMASVETNQPQEHGGETSPPPTRPHLLLQIRHDGFVLGSDVGERITIPKLGDDWDASGLAEHLATRRQVDPSATRLVVAPDDGIQYETVVAAMDTATGAGYREVSLTAASSL